MKVRIPAQTKELCDFCKRDGYLDTCLVCGRQYCLVCQCYLPGCMVKPQICKECDDRPDVKALADEFGQQIAAITLERDRKFKKLPPKPRT